MPNPFPFELMDPDLADALQRVWPKLTPSTEALKQSVDTRLATIEQAGADRVFVDVDGAREIAHRLHQLVKATEGADPAQRDAVGAAIAYFSSDDNPHADLDSMFGLQDDKVVLNAVMYYVRRARQAR